MNYGFLREDIIVAHPEHIHKVVGPNTKVVRIAENDPLGIVPATSSFTGLLGGEAYMPAMIRDARSGKIKVASSLPAHLAYQLIKLKMR